MIINSYVPDHGQKTALALAGLGEKKLSLYFHSDAKELCDQLLDYFPKLLKAGEYGLLRCGDKGERNLVLIDVPPAGYTVEYLKAVVSSAKIYIRPLQKNLDLSIIESVSSFRYLYACAT